MPKLNITGILMALAGAAVVFVIFAAGSGDGDKMLGGIEFLFIIAIPLAIALWIKSRLSGGGGGGKPRLSALAQAQLQQRDAIEEAHRAVSEAVEGTRAAHVEEAQQAIAAAEQLVAELDGRWV
ncbi:hypothetical protein [Mycolicibacterium fallax]|uniref:Uncharacterized protein n=1 Tax=Mycolicibacterium fallax TaxID=1793 RepID=A0A1X1R7U6_MYCFA|nr:hypothetical protein [Mycolicibacterium fallax]ORV00977.1 hypothetical protein AWC04_14995 [Mycolicibacterium fallax]BBZ00532.1 hypothetical protein MFAL_39980 [Mycolicibacterium fallax]